MLYGFKLSCCAAYNVFDIYKIKHNDQETLVIDIKKLLNNSDILPNIVEYITNIEKELLLNQQKYKELIIELHLLLTKYQKIMTQKQEIEKQMGINTIDINTNETNIFLNEMPKLTNFKIDDDDLQITILSYVSNKKQY